MVFAEGLGTAAVLAGIRAGRSWIAGSAAVALSFVAASAGRSAGIGERLATDGAPVTVDARVDGVPSGTVSFHTDRGTVHRASLPESGTGTAQWCTTAAESAFVRAEVRDAQGQMAAVTNPVVLA